METMLKTRVLFITIIALVVVNIGSLITIWVMMDRRQNPPDFRNGGMGMGPGRGQGMGRGIEIMLHNRLKFSDDQMAEFEKLKEEHAAKSNNIAEQIRSQKLQLNKLVADEKVDSVKFYTSVETIAALQSEMEKLNFTHFRDIRKICSDDQKAEFDKFISEELFSGMRRPGNFMMRNRGNQPDEPPME